MSHGEGYSPNYDYVAATAKRLAPRLDGCFRDFVGADTFATFNMYFVDRMPQPFRDRIFKYEVSLPFEDQSLDAVTANIAFAHVPDLSADPREIDGVLRTDGVQLELDPFLLCVCGVRAGEVIAVTRARRLP